MPSRLRLEEREGLEEGGCSRHFDDFSQEKPVSGQACGCGSVHV